MDYGGSHYCILMGTMLSAKYFTNEGLVSSKCVLGPASSICSTGKGVHGLEPGWAEASQRLQAQQVHSSGLIFRVQAALKVRAKPIQFAKYIEWNLAYECSNEGTFVYVYRNLIS